MLAFRTIQQSNHCVESHHMLDGLEGRCSSSKTPRHPLMAETSALDHAESVPLA